MPLFGKSMRKKNDNGPFQPNCTGSFPMMLSPDAIPDYIPHNLFIGDGKNDGTF